jgi:hypothetical protein
MNVEGIADLLYEPLIVLRARAGLGLALTPVVIAALGDGQRLAQRQDRMVGLQRVDPLVALLGGCERMPKVFFKMSRCSRKYAFSRRRASSCASSSLWAGATDGANWRFHKYNRFWATPRPAAIWLADLPLLIHKDTASRFKA